MIFMHLVTTCKWDTISQSICSKLPAESSFVNILFHSILFVAAKLLMFYEDLVLHDFVGKAHFFKWGIWLSSPLTCHIRPPFLELIFLWILRCNFVIIYQVSSLNERPVLLTNQLIVLRSWSSFTNSIFVFMDVWFQTQQGRRGFKKGQDGSDNQQKAISDELATALNDGLVFYEQVSLQTFDHITNMKPRDLLLY